MTEDLPTAAVDEEGNSKKIEGLAQRLAETEAALQSLTAGQVDAVLDPASGIPILLRQAQADLRRAHDELEERVKQRTEELARANRLLQALIETMPVGAVISDADGNVLLTNIAGREILGSEVHGSVAAPERSYTPHLPNGSPARPQDMPLMQALREGQTVRDVEILIRRKDGEERTILAGAAPVQDEAGAMISGITVFQDITERKRAELSLRQYADRLRILHSAGQVILTADSVEDIIETVLPLVCERLGCQWASVLALGQDTGEAVVLGAHPDGGTGLAKGSHWMLGTGTFLEDLTENDLSIYEDLSTLELQPELIEAMQADGVRSLVSLSLVAQGELLGVFNLSMDDAGSLTPDRREILRQMADEVAIGLRQAQLQEELERHAGQLESMVARRTAALRASEARFRTIFEDSVLGIALLGTAGQIVASNPALQNMLGYHEEELAGTAIDAYSHPDDAGTDQDLFEALANRELAHYQVEKRFVRKDGQVRWSALTVSRVETTRGDRGWLAVAALEDTTQRKESEALLIQSEKLAVTTKLTAQLAHEINNPLQSVIGCLGLAKEALTEGREVDEYVNIAMREMKRVARIVAQLRDMHAQPAKKQKREIDVKDLVGQVVMLTQGQWEKHGVEVEWQQQEDLPRLVLDPDRGRQVFLNLVLNAIESMPDQGQLRIGLQRTEEPPGVRFTFADTGRGIPSDVLPHVFEPFVTTKPDGMGLGLYVTREIVEEHGGHIEVDSRWGEGTTVEMWLPAEKDGSQAG